MHRTAKNIINLLFLAAAATACSQSPKIAEPSASTMPKPTAEAPAVKTQATPPVAAVVTAPAPRPAAKPSVPSPDAEYQAFFNESVQLINQYRASKKLSPLTRDGKLDAIAAAHSRNMAAKDDLSHDGFNSRFDQANMQSCAENVAWNQTTATELVNDWIASPVHDKNLLKTGATRVGMGRAKGYTTYFVCQP
jgi:uncharacterized protein YkwD